MQAKCDLETKLAEVDDKNAALDQVCSIRDLSLLPADHFSVQYKSLTEVCSCARHGPHLLFVDAGQAHQR